MASNTLLIDLLIHYAYAFSARLLSCAGTTKNWIAVEGALFSTSNYDTSLAALNSKLASSAPRGCIYPALQFQQQHSQQEQQHHLVRQQSTTQAPSGSGGSGEEKNVFAIYVSYYVKVEKKILRK
jgi:beta-arrestin